MTVGTREPGPLVGQIAAVSGALSLAAAAWVGVLTFSSLDPSNTVRIAGAVFLPLGICGAIGVGFAGRDGASRPWALLGVALAAAALIALTTMQVVVDH